MKGCLQRGLSLIELLIGLFLISLISATLIQAFVLHKRQYLAVQEQLERHLDGQWLRSALSDSVRRAGFTPCLSIEHLDVKDRRISAKFLTGEAIQIEHNTLHVNRMSEHFAQLATVFAQQQILVPQELQIRKRHSVLIANCHHAEIHQVIQIDKTKQGLLLTLDSPLFFSYSKITYIGRWLEETWFIKKNKNAKKALYYRLYGSEELSPYIDSLEIKKRKKRIVISLGFDTQRIEHFSVMVRS